MRKFKKVTIMGLEVGVRWVKKMPEGFEDKAAYFDPENVEIVVYDYEYKNKTELARTLIHEMVHVWQHRMGFFQERSLAPYHEIMAESLSNFIYESFDFR
jgi:hypothetical protein